MGLPAQVVHVPAGLPVDESTKSELSKVGTSNRANINVRQDDRMALRKRRGFTALSKARAGAAARSAGRKVFGFAGTPCVIDDVGNLDVYVEAKTTSYGCGRASSATYRLQPLPSMSASDPVTDIELVNGCMAVGYASGALAVIDLATGVSIAPVQRGSLSIGPLSVMFVTSFGGRYFVAYGFDGTANVVTPYTLDTQNPTAGWTNMTTITGVSFMSAASAGDRSVVLYSTGSTTINIVEYNQSGTVGTPATITGASVSVANFDVVVSPDASTMWISYFNPGLTVQARSVATPATIVSTAAAPAPPLFSGKSSLVAGDNNTTATVYISGVNTSGDRGVYMATVSTVAGATTYTGSSRTYGVQLMGRGIRQGGRTLLPVYGSPDPTAGANLYGTFTIVDATDPGVTISQPFQTLAPVANIEPGVIYASADATIGILSNKLVSDGAGNVYAAFSSRSGGGIVPAASFGTTSINNRLACLNFTSRARWQVAEHARGAYLSGAVLSVFDGSSVTEAGIIVAPPTAAYTTGTGVLNGVYRYVATYEAVDASGNWVVGGVSAPLATFTLANNAVTLTFSPLSITTRTARSAVRLAIYRTTTGGAAPYYRLGVVSNNPSPVTGRLTFVDNIADSAIVTGTKLYAPQLPGTAGESLDRRAPPGLIDVVSYNGMLVGVKGESVINSGQLVYGEAPWFNPVFEVPVSGGGDFVGLETIDGTLYLFKADRIFAITGTAPSDNGLQGGLGEPRLLASDVGCTDVNSIVATSLGIFFRSSRGFELLDRSGAVQFIGDSYHVTADANLVTTAAVLDERNGLVRFSVCTTDTSGVASGTGVDLVFDLTLKAWVSTDQRTGTTAMQPAQSAAMVYLRNDTRYAWLGSDGTLYAEKEFGDATECLDGSTWVQSAWLLPPWNFAPQQEQRMFEMMLLFERLDAAGLLIDLAYDYASFTDTKQWTEAETLGNRQLSFRPKPRGEATQLRVRDTAPAVLGTGRGITMIAISADIAPKQGPTRGTPRLNGALRK